MCSPCFERATIRYRRPLKVKNTISRYDRGVLCEALPIKKKAKERRPWRWARTPREPEILLRVQVFPVFLHFLCLFAVVPLESSTSSLQKISKFECAYPLHRSTACRRHYHPHTALIDLTNQVRPTPPHPSGSVRLSPSLTSEILHGC